jgi:hypothetical protein
MPRCAALYDDNVMLTKSLTGCTALKSRATKVARWSGMKKAKLARELAVIMQSVPAGWHELA